MKILTVLICVLISFVIFFVGFGYGNNPFDSYLDIGEDEGVIKREDISRHPSNHPSKKFTIDEEFALKIADAVLKDTIDPKITYNSVFEVYEEKDRNVYVITRSEISKGKPTGTKFSVALDKGTGAILRVWSNKE